MPVHPLSDLSFAETKQGAELIRELHAGAQIVFKAITFEEPRKEQVLQYFDAERNGSVLPSIPRIASQCTTRHCKLEPSIRIAISQWLLNPRYKTDLGAGYVHYHLR
jgi:hypothetical protein